MKLRVLNYLSFLLNHFHDKSFECLFQLQRILWESTQDALLLLVNWMWLLASFSLDWGVSWEKKYKLKYRKHCNHKINDKSFPTTSYESELIWRFCLDWTCGRSCLCRSTRNIGRQVFLFPLTLHLTSSSRTLRSRLASRGTMGRPSLDHAKPKHQRWCCCCPHRRDRRKRTLVCASYRDVGTCQWSSCNS